ncbi:uncharacterized protein SCDLUD_000374 [Saccharomycodes ludwigii]|uniref:uncharacterized protein n=1 Tax=Saccharomycodes ludwigii TaxID=36035 RepID=UPI001E8C8D37|nr:hypothetical protein SCDLUD_000374 [Saccharomycodes ludwigii]KAH3902783.1 hypothetical protein SCDLUD_000374 [Saccharomycodes ludwigii]
MNVNQYVESTAYDLIASILNLINKSLLVLIPNIIRLAQTYPNIAQLFTISIVSIILYKLLIQNLIKMIKWTIRIQVLLLFFYIYISGWENFVFRDIPNFQKIINKDENNIKLLFRDLYHYILKNLPNQQKMFVELGMNLSNSFSEKFSNDIGNFTMSLLKKLV